MSRNTEDNEGYIETEYEESLKEILLKKDLNIIFINGEFGSGKTTILKYVLNNLKNNNNLKIKNLKVYEEYIESNYIDYLYSTLRSEECWLWKWIKDNVIYIILSCISFGLIIISLLLKKFVINIGNSILFIVILFIVYIVFDFVKRKLEKSKLDKIKYIKKVLLKYDYLIIDDLDRVYIKTNEILKMIHFLQENLNDKTKLILLGDKSKFEDQDIDVLEKYYDYIFEVPKEILVQRLVDTLIDYVEEKWAISYTDEMESIKKIVLECTPRQLIKIHNHLKILIEDKMVFEAVGKLCRSDYLYMLVIYYKNNISCNEIIQLIKSFEIPNRIEWAVYEKADEFDKKNIDIIEKENKLTNEEKQYIVRAYNCYIKSDNGNQDTDSALISEWRIIDIPNVYNINGPMSDKESLNNLIDNFAINLYKDYKNCRYPINEIVRKNIGYEAYEKMLFERIEKMDDLYSRELFGYIYRNGRLVNTPDIDSHKNINLQYFSKIMESNSFSEKETYDNLNGIINDNNWEHLYYINKLDFLCREYYVEGVEQSRRDEVIKDPQEVIKILDKIVENPVMPSNFWYIFEDKINGIPGIEEKYIDFILDDMKGRTNMFDEQDIQNEENIKEIEKAYKNKK